MAVYKEDIVNIELNNGTIHRSFLNHTIGSGDSGANRFGVRVFRDGEPETLGGTCAGYFVRADGETVVIADGVVSGNMAYVTLPEACYAVEGNFTLAIKVSGGGATGTMRIVDGVVSRTRTRATVDPGTIIPSVEDLIDAIEAAVASVPAEYDDVWTTFAQNFSSSTAYSKGQYVTYNGALYRFTADHAAGSWDSSEVMGVSVGNEMEEVHETAMEDIDNLKKTEQVIPSVINGNGQKNYRFPDRISTDILDVTDENGNVLAGFDYNGNLKAKNFDSSRSVMQKFPYSPLAYDFAIQDEDGNIAFAIINGLAITNQRLQGKKLAIIGDSISTFSGWIPDGYETYYPSGNIDRVERTWWYKLINELGLKLIRNASWSGSRVSGNSQGTAFAACSDARVNAIVGDDEELPDIIITYISTNDWAGGVPVGSFTNKDEIPSEGVISEISKAYALMLYKIRTRYPLAQVYCVTSLEGRQTNGDTSYPIINSIGETIHDVNHAISEIAHIFGCNVIDLNVCGIHYWNVSSYTVDGTLHPNMAGAEIIKEVTKQTLINSYHNM